MDRLDAEAKVHPLFEGMEDDEIRGYLSERMQSFLAPYPWWYGHTGGRGGADTKHHASQQQYQARGEMEKDGSAMTNVIPVEDMPEKGGETVTGSEERSADLLAA